MRSLSLEVPRLGLDLARVRSTVGKYCHALEHAPTGDSRGQRGEALCRCDRLPTASWPSG